MHKIVRCNPEIAVKIVALFVCKEAIVKNVDVIESVLHFIMSYGILHKAAYSTEDLK